MNPALIISALEALAGVVEKLIADRNEDAAAALADVKTQIAAMKAQLDPGGTVDQAFGADDAKLEAAIDAQPGSGSGVTGAPVAQKP